jgi:hypothetical protein
MRMLSVLAVLCVTLFLGRSPAAYGAELAGKKPNIILIITDDQGYGDLACHGNPILKTPTSTSARPARRRDPR